MKESRFDQLVKERCEKLVNTLSVKGKEYRRGNDVFHNFNRTSQITGGTPERALLGFMLKHFVSVLDIIDDLDKGIVPKEEIIDEKLGDLCTYVVILETMLKDRNDGK